MGIMNIGLNNLFAVVITDGTGMLLKGGTSKSEYYWWKREIATYQAIRDLLWGLGVLIWIYYHEKHLDAIYKRNERLGHLYITATRFLAYMLYSRGVRKPYIGYPHMLSHNNGNKYNTNIWWYRKIVL
jgi:Probable transposase.